MPNYTSGDGLGQSGEAEASSEERGKVVERAVGTWRGSSWDTGRAVTRFSRDL
jgi:hypothetical protein